MTATTKHQGFVRARKPKQAEAEHLQAYPLEFEAHNPREESWAFRFLAIDNGQVVAAICRLEERCVMAEWEGVEGFPLGFVTLYWRSGDGGLTPHTLRVQGDLERAPRIRPELPSPAPKPSRPNLGLGGF